MAVSLSLVPSRILAALAALALVAPMVMIAPAVSADDNPDQGPEIVRVAGENRFDTAAQVAAATYETGADDVIVAAGFNFPDALAASGVGGLVDAPILLVNDARDEATSFTLEALADLDPDVVHVAGGTAAVSQAIEDEIAAAGDWAMNRFAGADRFATAALMAGVFEPADVAGSTAIVGTGFVAADSLSAGPLAHFGPHPILLTRSDALPGPTAAALDDLEVETVLVLGGESAVSADVVAQIEALDSVETVVRAAGANRFETAVEITEFEAFSGGPRVILATGFGPDDVPADALAGGPHGGVFGAELLPINDIRDELPEAIEAYLESIAEDLETIVVLGGEAAVSADVAADAKAAATTDAPPTNQTFTVTSDDDLVAVVGTEIDFTAEVGDAEQVTVWLLDAATVNVDAGFVSVNVDADGVLDPGTVAGADAAIVEIDGESVPDATVVLPVDVEDGEVAITINGMTANTELFVVVTEGDVDDVIDGDGKAIIDEDDALEVAFGVAGPVSYVDVEAAVKTVEFVRDDDVFAETETHVTLRVGVWDQLGELVAGEPVTFREIHGPGNFSTTAVPTSDGSIGHRAPYGYAWFRYSSDDNRLDHAEAEAGDVTAPTIVEVYWYGLANALADLSRSGIVGFDTDEEWIVVELADDDGHGDSGDYIRFDYGGPFEQYWIYITGAGYIGLDDKDEFEAALEDAYTGMLAVAAAGRGTHTTYTLYP